MPLTVVGTKSAIGLGNTASFLGIGGVGPYTYSVVAGGQGGTINSSTGLYNSPTWANYNSNPSNAVDTIRVTDSTTPTSLTATTSILVGPPLLLFLDIISTVLKLPAGRCWLYDQKVFTPTDPGLYVIVGVSSTKVFANSSQYNPTNDTYGNFVNCMAVLDVHVVSVDNSALFKKELVLAALMSPYSIQQQNANAFSIGRIPPGGSFNDLSEIDGPAIPYHFQYSIAMQYSVPVSFGTDVYTSFQNVVIDTDA